MKEVRGTIKENREIAPGIFEMKFDAPDHEFTKPGQFEMLSVPGKFLRRPISVSDFDGEGYSIIYKTVGEGTGLMSQMSVDEEVAALTGLGNGYDIESIPEDALLVGGGIGIPPLIGLAKRLAERGKIFRVLLGYNRADEVFASERFSGLTERVTLMTADGSAGGKGFVTDAFDREEYICACGPTGMLKALNEKCDGGQFSLEARMGCGFGACMGCSVRTKSGSMRVCKEGPVFNKEVIEWDSI